MTHPDWTTVSWRASSRSNGGANCVEVAVVAGVVGVRNSNDESGPILAFSRQSWREFIDGVKSGDFDRQPGYGNGSVRLA